MAGDSCIITIWGTLDEASPSTPDRPTDLLSDKDSQRNEERRFLSLAEITLLQALQESQRFDSCYEDVKHGEWLSGYLEDEITFQRIKEMRSRVLADEIKLVLDDNTLYEVAEKLGSDWVILAIKLGITTIRVRNIEKNYPNDITRQAHEMLVTWKQAQVSSAERQFATLYKALKNIRREDIASFLYEPHLDDVALVRTAVELDDKWKPLAVDELGFTKSKVETIEQKYEEDIPRQGYNMLKTWQQDQPTCVELQVDTLCTALKNIGRADIVVFLHERIRLLREMKKTLIT